VIAYLCAFNGGDGQLNGISFAPNEFSSVNSGKEQLRPHCSFDGSLRLVTFD
jgi:hypothetical protein